jgi:hypothetical protein
MQTRRDFLIGAASLATVGLTGSPASGAQRGSGQAWDAGDLVHVLPAATHDRFLIKTSFKTSHAAPPVLVVAGRKIPGRAGDTLGFFWAFDAAGLEPNRPYALQISMRGRAVRSVAAETMLAGRQPKTCGRHYSVPAGDIRPTICRPT